MSSSAVFLCIICQDNYAIADIRSLPCGHTNCATCLNQYLGTAKATRGAYPCPHCRKPFKATQAHQIFLEDAESATQAGGRNGERICHTDAFHRQVASALREVRRVEEDQRRQTVQRAAHEMDKVVELMSGRDCLLNLLTVVAARWRGMLPLFDTIARQRAEINSAQHNLQKAKDELATANELLQGALQASEEVMPELKRTQSELKSATMRISKLEEERARQSERLTTELMQKNEEVGRLHTQLQALKAKERKQMEQINKLRKEKKALNQRLHVNSSQHHAFDTDSTQGPDVQAAGSVSPHPCDVGNLSETSLECIRLSSHKRKRSAAPSPSPSPIDVLESENVHPVDMPDLTRTVSRERQWSPEAERFSTTITRYRGAPEVKPPSFNSEWQLPTKQSNSSSRVISSTTPSALHLNRSGKPLAAVSLGSRKKAKFL